MIWQTYDRVGGVSREDFAVPLGRRARFFAGLVGAGVALGAVGVVAVVAADHAVSIAGSAFSPPSLTVTVGDTVTWTNSDQIPHTATADGGSFDTGTLDQGASNTVTFNTAGTFPYHCTIHPQMTATITVEAAPSTGGGGGGATTTQPPTDTFAVDAAGDGSGSGVGFGALLLAVGAFVLGLAVVSWRLSRR